VRRANPSAVALVWGVHWGGRFPRVCRVQANDNEGKREVLEWLWKVVLIGSVRGC